MRSRIPSATVESPICWCHLGYGNSAIQQVQIRVS